MDDNMAFAVFLTLLPAISGEMKVVDLTWTQGPKSVSFPGNPPMEFSITYRGIRDKYWYENNWFSTAEHVSTHMDSPSHFYKGGWRMHEIPPDRLIGPAVVIDIRSKVAANPDYRVQSCDFRDYEYANGRIPNGAIVVMNSGWSSRYPDKYKVFNTNEPNQVSTFHFPGFHEDGVSWLLTNRNVSMIGVDTPSTDHGQSTEYKVHRIIGRYNVPGLENVANLDKIPVKGATIFAGAIKLYEGSGGPTRIIAIYDDQYTP